MFDTKTRLFFFACLKDAAGAGAVLKSAAPAPGSDPKKNWLRLRTRPKSGGSRLQLRNTASYNLSLMQTTLMMSWLPSPENCLQCRRLTIDESATLLELASNADDSLDESAAPLHCRGLTQ